MAEPLGRAFGAGRAGRNASAMMTRGHVLVALATAAFSVAALAEDPALLRAIGAVAGGDHAVQVMAANQPVWVVPVPGDDCPSVGVIHSSAGRTRGGSRIDNYRVCSAAVPERLDEVSPALPESRYFQQTAMMVIRGALRYGVERVEWEAYRVDACRLSGPDVRGCAEVETIVSSQGLLVSFNVGRLCP